MAAGGQLLFLYELERQVRPAHSAIDRDHVCERPAFGAGEYAGNRRRSRSCSGREARSRTSDASHAPQAHRRGKFHAESGDFILL